MRGWVEDNRTLYDNETFAEVLRTFPQAPELSQLIQRDSQLHLDATSRAGVRSDGPEPISLVHFQFDLDPLSQRRVAAELGVPPAALGAELGALDARLGALAAPDGTIDRATLTDTYASALCALHTSSKNRPVTCP